jgi:hypothetical protein
MEQPKPDNKLVCITYKNGKRHITFNIANTRLEDWVDKQVILQNLHISDGKLQYMRDQKQIPYAYFGKKILYHLPAIIMMIEQSLLS